MDQAVSALHYSPVCNPVAFAEHLFWQTGCAVSDEQILAVYREVGDVPIAELIEYFTVNGFAGYRLDSFARCDESLFVSGLVYGIDMAAGYHAALAHTGGLISWGLSVPLIGVPVEAWQLRWR